MKSGIYNFIVLEFLVAEFKIKDFDLCKLDDLWRHNVATKWCKLENMEYLCKYKVYRVEILQSWSAARTTYCNSESTFLKWKMPYLLLRSLTDFLVLVLVLHICSHSLTEQQEQVTLLEGGKLWVYSLNGEGLESGEIFIFLWFYITLCPHCVVTSHLICINQNL